MGRFFLEHFKVQHGNMVERDDRMFVSSVDPTDPRAMALARRVHSTLPIRDTPFRVKPSHALGGSAGSHHRVQLWSIRSLDYVLARLLPPHSDSEAVPGSDRLQHRRGMGSTPM